MSDALPTGERLERAKQLLRDALDMRAEDARSWVREQAGDDAALAHYVLDLLGGGDARTEVVDFRGVREAAQDYVRSQQPTRIGRYRIVETLGEGGMGTVYLAEQTEPVQRRVAVKLVKLGMDSAAVVARFEHERQSLAMMEHDGIAKVHDCGTSERGQPFFVMELVRGTPIADYCDAHRLPLRARIELLQQVCDAVQHAHQKGVVHRDLKPSNVLVVEADGRAQVKVIDFGLAKAMSSGADETPLLTDPGQIVGTVEYMSPEQADPGNVDVDTRADVYSLGVMLYELLVGSLPFADTELRGAGLLELQRVMQEVEPARPSQRFASTTPEQQRVAAANRRSAPAVLLRQLRTDLDWIVLRAMAKRRDERYETPAALSADLQRFLTYEPVLAGPPTAGYRLKKFVRRYRSKVLAAAAVLLTALTGAVVAIAFAVSSGRNADLFANKVREFDLLAGVVLHDRAVAAFAELQPAWPATIPRMEQWLQQDVGGLVEMLPEIERTIADLRRRAAPRSDEQLAADRRAHPAWREFDQVRGWVAAERRALAVRAGEPLELPTPPDGADEMSVEQLLGEVLPRVAANPYQRAVVGEERQGLAYARLAAEKARGTPREGQALAFVAMGFLALGEHDEVRRNLDLAMERAPPAMRAALQGVCDQLLQRTNRDETELRSQELRLDALRAEVEEGLAYEFALESQHFLHASLVALRADIARLRQERVPLVERRLRWARAIADASRDHPNARVGWDEARAAIRAADGVVASERYRGQSIELRDEDVLGLVPIGMNPVTKLWEFYHLASAWTSLPPRELPIPRHREDGSIAIEGATGMVFVLVPGGTFLMGAQRDDPGAPNYEPDAQWYVEPPNEVTLAPFFLSRYEMTIRQWQCMWQGSEEMAQPSQYQVGAFLPQAGERVTSVHPVNQVDWHRSQQLLTLHGLTLPTEAQWEYACRAGTTTPWFCELDELYRHANLADDRARRANPDWEAYEEWDDGHVVSSPVGALLPNPWGFHDMAGNVCEWCLDPREGYDVPPRAGDGLRADGPSPRRVIRGGSMTHRAMFAKSSMRTPAAMTEQPGHFGVRAARALRPGN